MRQEIIDWLGLSSSQRTLATTHILWVIFAFVLLLRFSTKLLQETKIIGKEIHNFLLSEGFAIEWDENPDSYLIIDFLNY